MIGPGKYDELLDYVSAKAGITDGKAGVAAIVIILNGNKGDGFSCACDVRTLGIIPETLELVAKQLREDREKVHGGTN